MPPRHTRSGRNRQISWSDLPVTSVIGAEMLDTLEMLVKPHSKYI